MPATFSRSISSLRADGFGRPLLALAVVALLLGAWGLWFWGARVTLYQVSAKARLEVRGEVHAVQAPLAGTVVRSRLTLGREVARGDVLLELDSAAQRLQLAEAQARQWALGLRLAALNRVLEAERKALKMSRAAAGTAIEEARARHRERSVMAAFHKEQARRLTRLQAGGQMAKNDYLRALAQARSGEASEQTLKLAVAHLMKHKRTQASDRKARLQLMISEAVSVEGQVVTLKASVKRLQHELRRRVIRAPVAGRVGDLAALKEGSYVRQGDRVCSVVPRGKLRVVAHFDPRVAVGRVQTGQRARVRLHGFSWMQYGHVPAVVARVADEPRERRLRVELTVQRQGRSARIPMRHGLEGTAEVEVERVSPAALLLRAAGRLVAGEARADPAEAPR